MNASYRMSPRSARLRHTALFYSGLSEFTELTASFVRQGLEAGEAVLILARADKIRALRDELGAGTEEVLFGDMGEVGRNPARIIPAWQDFVTAHGDGSRKVRGISEPIWPGRTREEIVEVHRHESLINLALAEAPFLIACAYDVSALEPGVVEEALRTHPFVLEDGGYRDSPNYRDEEISDALADPLPEPGTKPQEMPVSPERIGALRTFVSRRAAAFGLSPSRTEDLVLAVNEMVTNTLRHGGGRGVLRIWHEGESLVCEVRDGGHIDEPLVGRERPSPMQEAGFGLWLVNQLCDLVQLRSLAGGSIVRVHMARTIPQSVA